MVDKKEVEERLEKKVGKEVVAKLDTQLKKEMLRVIEGEEDSDEPSPVTSMVVEGENESEKTKRETIRKNRTDSGKIAVLIEQEDIAGDVISSARGVKEIRARMSIRSDILEKQETVEKLLRDLGVTKLKKNWLVNAISVSLTPEQIGKLAKDPKVKKIRLAKKEKVICLD